jgi:hypothetical protein
MIFFVVFIQRRNRSDPIQSNPIQSNPIQSNNGGQPLYSASFIRSHLMKEAVVRLDMGYLSHSLHDWYNKQTHSLDLAPIVYIQNLMTLLLAQINKDDLQLLRQVGYQNGPAALILESLFLEKMPSPMVYLIHESLSSIAGLLDIQYPYESHKLLYLKNSTVKYKEWGNGLGDISPHSDDLYESVSADLLSLTVARDDTQTPTDFYLASDLLLTLTDDDLEQCFNLNYSFISGKNVDGLKQNKRKLLAYSDDYGFECAIDFRTDQDNGARMRAMDDASAIVLNKLKKSLSSIPKYATNALPGTMVILANKKVLHARSELHQHCSLDASQSLTPQSAPRLLFRSKGPRYLSINYFKELN